eukprot:m.109776 g.109776  ORF g.109776 m.109776 type:complete len:94 (+) comp12853_c0_seq3:6706-6987(+)
MQLQQLRCGSSSSQLTARLASSFGCVPAVNHLRWFCAPDCGAVRFRSCSRCVKKIRGTSKSPMFNIGLEGAKRSVGVIVVFEHFVLSKLQCMS